MESIVKPNESAREKYARYVEARKRAKSTGRDVKRASNDEMIEMLQRHIRILKEVAKRNGLDAGDDYDDF